MQLHVAGALELLEDDVVHAAAGVHQRRGDDGQAAAVFDVARRAEEALRLEQRPRIQTAGERTPRGRNHQVVGPGQAGDGVQQHHHVLPQLHQPLGALQHHLGDPGVVLRGLVEGGVDHLALDGALHVGHFLRALVDQQHDQVNLGIVGDNGVGNLLQKRGLARLGLGDDHAALALADGRDHVDQPQRDVLALGALQPQPLVGVHRNQRIKGPAMARHVRRLAVDLADVDQAHRAVAQLLGAGLAHHVIAGAQVEAANLRRRDVHVPVAGQVVVHAQKAVALGVDLQDARAVAALAAGEQLGHGGVQLVCRRSLHGRRNSGAHGIELLHRIFLSNGGLRRGDLAVFRTLWIALVGICGLRHRLAVARLALLREAARAAIVPLRRVVAALRTGIRALVAVARTVRRAHRALVRTIVARTRLRPRAHALLGAHRAGVARASVLCGRGRAGRGFP